MRRRTGRPRPPRRGSSARCALNCSTASLRSAPAGCTPSAAARSQASSSTGWTGIETYFADYLPQKTLAAFVPLAILVAVFPKDWVSGLILTITAPIIPLFMVIVGKGAESLNQRQWRRLALLGAHFFDVLEGLTTLKLFNASRREAETIARISDEYRKTTMEVLRVAFLSSLVLEFFATFGVAMVAVFIGFRLLSPAAWTSCPASSPFCWRRSSIGRCAKWAPSTMRAARRSGRRTA